ncbi:MAG TPA: hypothetical protein VGD71_15965 [Kribbella sp.]|jgi:hypothetical protein
MQTVRVEDVWFKDMDEESVTIARQAISTLVGDGDLDVLNQRDVQQFLWYTLPTKWFVETAEHHEIAWVLGDAFRNAGLDRYAAICRALETHLIIGAYAESDEKGFAACDKAMKESGIEPPKTDLLAWSEYMGPAELAIWDRLSSTLERAIAAGDLVPGARGWKKAAERISKHFLLSEGPDGRVPVEVVETERLKKWSLDGGPDRQRLRRSLLPLLSEVSVPGAGLAESLAPARALLEGVGEGATLTKADYLPRALAVDLNDRFRWYDLPGYNVTSESDVLALQLLHGLLRRSRLLTKRGRRLTVSAEGRRCLGDDQRLFRLLAVQVLSGSHVDLDIARLKAGALLVAGEARTTNQLAVAILPAVEEAWRSRDGQPVGLERVKSGGLEWRLNATTFGWLNDSRDYYSGYPQELTALGRVASAIALRALAAAPRKRP